MAECPRHDEELEAIVRYYRDHRSKSVGCWSLDPSQPPDLGVWHFAAWLKGEPVGHSTLCLTTGALGIAGIYDVGVVPDARNQGIGKAVST